ncbi:MAG: DUF4124 domain-containing protein [Gammaproteobacteria bacterium]|nr:DUF4124 domain-containing protein [Gammaproteobacteria bacterium]
MKRQQIALACAVAALTVAPGVTANEIYKWTDTDGNVHYEDRPSGAPTEERIDIGYRRTDNSAVRKRVSARVDAQAARAEADSAAAAAEKEAEENAAAEAERQKACERSRARLESYLQARRLYRTDDAGERVYLDDAQREEARRKAEEQIAEFCS